MKPLHQQFLKRLPGTLLFAGLFLVPVLALAQGSMHLPIVGRQFPTAGLSLSPGFFYDGAVNRGDIDSVAPTAGGTLRLGLQHIVSRNLSMSGEIEAGLHYLAAHTASPYEVAPSQLAFAWQLTMLGRWFPIGEESGWTAALGGHYFRASLKDAPLLSLGADLRVGRFIWTSDERFIIIEAGYSAPLLQGLRISPTIAEEIDELPAKTWSLHRFSLGLTMAF